MDIEQKILMFLVFLSSRGSIDCETFLPCSDCEELRKSLLNILGLSHRDIPSSLRYESPKCVIYNGRAEKYLKANKHKLKDMKGFEYLLFCM